MVCLKSRRSSEKRDYYCQSRRGNRLFELGLGLIALAFTAASSKADQATIADLLSSEGRAGFAIAWLRHKGLEWAIDCIDPAAEPKAAAVLEEAGS
jgi:type IV secretion system protein TrbE